MEFSADVISTAAVDLPGPVTRVEIFLDNTSTERPRGKMQVVVSDLTGCVAAGLIAGNSDALSGDLIEDDFKIFPNPVTERLTIQTKEVYPGGQIMLLNTMGQLVKIVPITDQHRQSMLVHDLSSGIYLLKFKPDDHKAFVKQVVIMD